MRKAPGILFVLVGLLVLIVAAASVFLYITHLQAAKPDISEIKSMVSSYYDKKGEWAGQYVIEQIDQVKSISQDNTKFTVCVAYQYAYPYQSKVLQGGDWRTFLFQLRRLGLAAIFQTLVPQGGDRRTFLFQYIQDSWQVIKMGGHLSC